ncbi:hypothetical protein CUREO4125_04155 [Campylobacter ureolyticus]|uniref:5' nucleotidase, NT5C type n=1 Tax=Campylobacter ureolyticus TaxID=827 RepID=UPI00215B09FF|nr:hypothetical protein [Campylobacter ureolyticus]MCR8699575.1 hypothetical protein [Campylobacter ureolyticus]
MKILYIDMDNVLVDFTSALKFVDEKTKEIYKSRLDEIPGIFSLMKPMPNAIKSYEILSKKFDTYILSTAPWHNSSAWGDKLEWVQKYLGNLAYKRLILTHHKNLNLGDYLVDDRLKNGASEFKGEHIHFGKEPFLSWDEVAQYLLAK